ncbi:MAG: beta-3-deoxy-D-manno-oct-2-ulosonic acid transferase [Roseomonas sp.]|nr:beta-3-deoxy-D-manno-oct-2-ulosonic acid transferase [Roseomonas sp.]
MNPPPALALPPEMLAAAPHFAAFWPECLIMPWSPGVPMALPFGAQAPPGADPLIRFTPGPWGSIRLGPQTPLVALIAAPAPDPIAAALASPAPEEARAATPGIMARLVAARLGGPSGLPDPGGAALGLAPHGTAILLDPCDPAQRSAAEHARDAARAAGLPIHCFRDPFAAPDCAPLWPDSEVPCDPWSLLDGAAILHGASRPLALLALAAGVALGNGPLAGADPADVYARLIAATRAADPFRRAPCRLEEALDLLTLWRRHEAENRRIAACHGVQGWKRARVGALLASAGPAPEFSRGAKQAIATAKARGGAALVWAARSKPALTASAKAAKVPLVFLEDGFLRSAGIGAAFRPGGSFVLDHQGPHYDPAQPSDLENLLNRAEFPGALRARAAALRQAIIAQGLTKYNLTGAAPVIAAPPGKQRILVPGQVEDDASVLKGGGGMTNLALLRAVRAAAPDAFLIYKPHPDVEAGFRRGRITTKDLAHLADHVAVQAPMAGLLAEVDAVHCLTSLTGFEALLRGLPVTLWGQPFYAGWGLTDDRGPAFPVARRQRRLDLESLIAGALILYPRYIDPVTHLPCPVEVFLERLATPEYWPLAPGGRWRAAQGWVRRQAARLLRRR